MTETDFWAQIHTPAGQAEQLARAAQAQAASALKLARLEERAQQLAAQRAQQEAERAAFLQAAQARREAFAAGDIQPLSRGDVPSLAQLREAERAQDREADKQREAAARQGMSDFVLHHLPRHDPQMVAYRAAVINPPVVDEGDELVQDLMRRER